MITLLALFLIQDPQILPNLKAGHCYKTSTEYRPDTIGISGIERGMYKYHIFYGFDVGWSGALYGKIYTLNYVYNEEIKCP